MNKRSHTRLATVFSVLSASVLGAVATLGLPAFAADTIDWTTTTTSLRSQIGQTFSFICPPSGTIGTVLGSVIYADDSSVCSAAVHAGKITAASGGAVTVSILPGQPVYPGANVNGVTSQDHVNGSGSFIFFDTEGFASDVEASRAASAARANRTEEIYIRFDAEDRYSDPRNIGQEFTLNCMMDPWVDDYVWGTDVYHGQSSVCLAAVHAGLINVNDGGEITLRIERGRSSYAGSDRNGIASRAMGNADPNTEISFTFVR